MAKTIPLSQTLGAYTEQIDLEDSTYVFAFTWNERAQNGDGSRGSWFLDILDVDGNLIVAGRRCVVNTDLLAQYHHLAVPPGALMAFDTTNRELDPSEADFGTRVVLVYMTAAEVAAAEAP